MSMTIARRRAPLAARLGLANDISVVVAVVTAFAASVVMFRNGFAVSRSGPGDVRPLAVVLILLSTAPIVLSRRAPFVAFVVAAVGNLALTALVRPIGVPIGPGIALYLLAAGRGERRPSTRQTAIVVALLAGHIAAAGIRQRLFPGVELLHAGLLWTSAWLAGERTRLRRAQLAELRARADRDRLLAAAEERARIARDLHDSVGHAINVISVRAGAARLRHHEDPQRSLEALEAIEELARRTAEDIDHLVGALRDRAEAEPLIAPTGVASIPTLVEQHRATGLDVRCVMSGVPRPLATGVDQAAYRIVQEALTNASRHGCGCADVRLDFGPAALVVDVTNPVDAKPAAGARPRHGLVGVGERTRLLGGTLTIDDRGDEYQLRVELPYTVHGERPS